jgi:hypothetical protein
MEVTCPSETPANSQQTTQHYIARDRILLQYDACSNKTHLRITLDSRPEAVTVSIAAEEGIPLMHQLKNLLHKEFSEMLLKPLCHCNTDIFIQPKPTMPFALY